MALTKIKTGSIADNAITDAKVADNITAGTAATLATARNINGVSFNGSSAITVTAAAGTLTGNTLASGVTASSLTSVGTLSSLTVSGQTRVGGAGSGSSENLLVTSATSSDHTRVHIEKTANAGSAGVSLNSYTPSTSWTIYQGDDSDGDLIFYDDSGSVLTLATDNSATFAGAVQVNNNNLTAKMTTAGAGIRSIVDRVDTSDYAGFEVRTGGNQRWFIGAREDSTDNLQFYNGNSSGTVQNVLTLNHSNSLATFAGLLQAKRGFTNGQALDIEGETFGRTNGSSYAFGYRQDHASGGLMQMQKGSTNVFLMTNSGRIAQEIDEASAYAATFENTNSGGYGLRAYGGASSADNALWIADKDGNEAFSVKANGITVSDGKIRQAYVSATYPQNATTTRTFNIMTLLGHSAGTPYGLVEFLFNIYTNGGNTDCEVHRITLGGYMHAGYSQDLAWNLVHEVVDAGSGNSAINSVTLTGTGGDLNISYINGDSNDDAYLRGIMRGWGA